MNIPTGEKVTEWIEEQGDIYGSWFYDWIQEGDLIDANVYLHRDSIHCLFEQGVSFGLSIAENGSYFEASPYLEDSQWYFLGNEDDILKKLKNAWAAEFETDDPPLPVEDAEKLYEREKVEQEIRELEAELRELKGQ